MPSIISASTSPVLNFQLAFKSSVQNTT